MAALIALAAIGVFAAGLFAGVIATAVLDKTVAVSGTGSQGSIRCIDPIS